MELLAGMGQVAIQRGVEVQVAGVMQAWQAAELSAVRPRVVEQQALERRVPG